VSTKLNLPKTLGSDYSKFNELALKYNRTTTGNTSYVSPSSGVTYNTLGTAYAGQGEEGLCALLQIALEDYIILALDFNNKIDTGALSDTDITVDDSGFDTLTGTDQGDINANIDTLLTADTIDYVRNPGYAVTSGSPTAYTITLTPAPTAYATGMRFAIKLHVDCGAAPTINVNSLGAKTLLKNGDTAIIATEYKQNMVLDCIYDGTNVSITAVDYTGETLTTQGDMLYRDSSGLKRLAKGTAGSILKVNTGATAPDYLALGAAGQVLEVNDGATAPIWRTKLNKEIFTSSGTFTAPKTGVYKVTIVGGGGSSASNQGGSNAYLGGGGGGGVAIEIVSLTVSDAVAVTVGAGGTDPASAATHGNTGSTSSFGAYCSATGGAGGYYAASGLGAAGDGGIGSGGDINLKGGYGGFSSQINGINTAIQHLTSLYEPYGRGGYAVFGTAGQAGVAGICIIEW
jgi:hypothetical protein